MTDLNQNLPAISGRTMQIKNLCPGLMEMGKIKIGRKGESRATKAGGSFQLPQKLDHFIVTTMERGQDNNFLQDEAIHAKIGAAPKEIPVRLLYDDPSLNFPTRYSCYDGKTLACSGDGETALRLTQGGDRKPVTCPCERQAPTYTGRNKCKINGVLSVLIEGAEMVGGVWKFRTTSYNTVVGILSSLALIRRITGGPLAGIPLMLTVTPKSVTDPVQGSQQTIYVVGLTYRGSVETLQDKGYQIAMHNAKHGVRIEQIENEARRLLTYDEGEDASAAEIVEEFYPEEAAAAAGVSLAKPAKPAGPAPALVAPTDEEEEGEEIVEAEIEEEEEETEAPVRERGKPSPGKQRRTRAEVEEDEAADRADAEAAAAAEATEATEAATETKPTQPAKPAGKPGTQDDFF